MVPAKEMIGRRFDRLVVLKREGVTANRLAAYVCQCDCGNTKVIDGGSLRLGRTRSCGCLVKECGPRVAIQNTTHGMRYTKTYKSWCNMIQRCANPNLPKYSIYGGRGITVCERWRTFENFFADMGSRPTGGSIERMDTNGNYELGNCKWIPMAEQALNRRNNLKITHNGETRNLCEWAKIVGLDEDTLGMRLLRGWSVERALTEPKRRW